MTSRTYSLAEAQARLSRFVDQAQSGVEIELTRRGRPVAVLVSCQRHGFRPSKRYIVFQVLPDTLGLGPEVWRVLSKSHDMRNRTEYERVLDIDVLVEMARKLYPWFPLGEIIEHEAPDFLLVDGADRIGIEVAQLFQPPKQGSQDPPREVARFHRRVMEIADRRAASMRPLDVLVYFSYQAGSPSRAALL